MRHAAVRASILGLILTTAGYSSAGAGGLYLNDFATPSMGTSGAGSEAIANDASTAFSFANPAGMTRLQGTSISMGVGLLGGKTKFNPDSSTPFSGGSGGNQAGLAPLLGSQIVHSITDDLKIGMSVFSLSGAALDPNDSWTGRYQNTEINLLTLTANPSIAYRVNDTLSLGAGVTLMFADIEYDLTAPPIRPPAGGAGEVKIDGNDFALGYNFGALFELSPQTRIGVTYVSKVEPKFSGDLKIYPGPGGSFSANSDLEFTFPQLIRAGIYHELNSQWALLGSVGWEDWSDFDTLLVSTERGSASIPTKWKDTYHASAGLHYRPRNDWLLQAGITYDTSPVSKNDRTANLPIDRQIRVSVGAQHQLSDKLTIGGAITYIDLGMARINNPSVLQGNFDTNRLVMAAVNMTYKF